MLQEMQQDAERLEDMEQDEGLPLPSVLDVLNASNSNASAVVVV